MCSQQSLTLARNFGSEINGLEILNITNFILWASYKKDLETFSGLIYLLGTILSGSNGIKYMAFADSTSISFVATEVHALIIASIAWYLFSLLCSWILSV